MKFCLQVLSLMSLGVIPPSAPDNVLLTEDDDFLITENDENIEFEG